jgi:hypothetical protein
VKPKGAVALAFGAAAIVGCGSSAPHQSPQQSVGEVVRLRQMSPAQQETLMKRAVSTVLTACQRSPSGGAAASARVRLAVLEIRTAGVAHTRGFDAARLRLSHRFDCAFVREALSRRAKSGAGGTR